MAIDLENQTERICKSFNEDMRAIMPQMENKP